MLIKNLSAALASLSLLFTFYNANSQTADEIIGHSVDAVGGKALLDNIHSVIYEGVASVMGNDLPVKTTVVQGKGYKSVTSFNGMDIIQCLTDKTGWMINPMQGQTSAVQLPDDIVKLGQQSLLIGTLLPVYQNLGYHAELAGHENVNGVSAWKIKLSREGYSTTFYDIDPSSWYVLRTETHAIVSGADVTNAITCSNYKKTDAGYITPFTMVTNNMGYEITLNYSKITINATVDLAIFSMPE
jgi:hypothetical protein